jgi:hypothetical protein
MAAIHPVQVGSYLTVSFQMPVQDKSKGGSAGEDEAPGRAKK